MKRLNPVHKYILTLTSMIRTNIRDYGMYIALAVIFIAFSIMTGGNFLKPTNFTNLLNQTAYVSVLAVGMTLVIVTKQIDLSVGYLGAFLGAYVVVAVEVNGQSVLYAVLMAFVITIVVGIIKGFFIAKVKIPAFVVTLAGMFIFKGLLMIKTNNRTIPTTNDFFDKIGTGYLTENVVGTLDTVTAVIGAALILLVLFFGITKRRKNKRLGIPLEKVELFVTKMVMMVGLIIFIFYTLAMYRGISYLLLITAVIVVIYHVFTTQTVLGRRIYAVGGNPEAAELSGISVEKTLIIVFISMGILAVFSGVMYASMLQNTSPNHGPFWELYAIASAFIGGTSADGGVGKVVNAFIGSIVIMSLKNGMALAAVNSNIEPIILGSVLLLAVVFDVYTRNVRGADMVGMHYAKLEYKTDYGQAKEKYKEANQNLKEALKIERAEAKVLYNERLAEARVGYKSTLVPLIQAVKANKTAHKATFKTEKTALKEQQKEQQSLLLQKYSEKESEYKRQVAEVKATYKETLKSLKEQGYQKSYKAKMADAKQAYKTKVSDLKATYKENLDNLKAQYQGDKDQFNEHKVQLKNDYVNQKQALQDTKFKSIDKNQVVQAKDTYLIAKDKLKKDHVQLKDDKFVKVYQQKIEFKNQIKALNDKKNQDKIKLENAKKAFNDQVKRLKSDRSFNSPKIIDLEYHYTSALGELNRIKDAIRGASEEDYQDRITIR